MDPTVRLRDAHEGDFDAILALNDAEVRHTSAMDAARLALLHGLAWRHRVAEADGQVAALLLVMRDGAPYANPNFEWFARRFARFAYVDRVVVGAQWQGRGLGARLYAALFDAARHAGIGVVACEYNVVPPNLASQRFHARFGFTEAGRQWLDGGARQVSMQVAGVDGVATDR